MRNIHTFFACICCLTRRFYLPLQTYNHKKSSCARTDVAVQKVESGKFNKITFTEDLSGRVHICTGCGFLFHVFFVIGFYQSLALRKRGVAEHTRSCIRYRIRTGHQQDRWIINQIGVQFERCRTRVEKHLHKTSRRGWKHNCTSKSTIGKL